jgi:succinoglycan biosynthesis protein ExoA
LSGEVSKLDDVLVVVPCLNEAAHLPSLLALLAGDALDALIVVADGGSTDGSPALVQAAAAQWPNIKLLHNPHRIQSAAVNLAAQVFGAGKRWLVRVDAHCDYPEGYVRGLVAAAGRTGAKSVVVPMVTIGKTCFQSAAAAAQNSKLGTGGSAHRSVVEGQFVDHGHHALFDLAAYLAVGGYDENFSHNEDAELDIRLGAQGVRIWIEPTLALTYYPRRTPRALFRQYFSYGKGRARTVLRHKTRLKLRQALPLAVPPAVVLALAAPLQPLAAVPALVWAVGCLSFGLVLAVKARKPCVALSGVAAMIMHFAWSLGFLRQLVAGATFTRPEAVPSAGGL